ncbi:hypothetical protein AKJ09_05922 [Labilithrix luteola]|uniref:Outer membrane protein beta-barrel domain-containing protein n=1 Tax=Labilithrix luteola TaxID=1391654 RepID=A0A0K1Q0G1_9BACT|nr:hypothetical protein [Labilithrix luteola]AKU99258.1 hypothetical protein AKJ09_05922 [Labilithrix luteola]
MTAVLAFALSLGLPRVAAAQDAPTAAAPTSAPAAEISASASSSTSPSAAAEAAVSGAPSPDVTPTSKLPAAAEDPTMRKIEHHYRNGVVLGVAPGVGFAGSSGYPNDAKFIGNPDFFSSSPLLVGSSTTIFLQGAFTDYVSFGPMVNIATFENDKWRSTGWAIGFRADAFPLVDLFPTLANMSAYLQAGFGTTELRAKGPYPTADGSQSFLGGGLHHEFRAFRLLGGHAAFGPYVEYDAIFSKPAERHWLTVGLRLAWYGGAVTADKR